MAITLTIHLPDDLADQLACDGRDLERAALEAFGVAEYRAQRLTYAQLGQILELSPWAVDGVLKKHEVWVDYALDVSGSEREEFAPLRD